MFRNPNQQKAKTFKTKHLAVSIEMSILRAITGHTLKDRITNKEIGR